jgi:hypothetical protein
MLRRRYRLACASMIAPGRRQRFISSGREASTSVPALAGRLALRTPAFWERTHPDLPLGSLLLALEETGFHGDWITWDLGSLGC